MEDPMFIKKHLMDESRSLERYNLKAEVYGSGRRGYQALNEFLRGNREFTSGVYKQAYEYWCFLMFFQYLAKKHNFQGFTEETVFLYEPCEVITEARQPASLQTPFASFFIEPGLGPYRRREVLKGFNLSLIGEEDKMHLKPDLVITEPELDFIQVSGVHLGFEDGADRAKKDREKIFPQIKYLIEKKHKTPNKNDLKQFLWYCAAYHLPSILICQEPSLGKFEDVFLQDVKELRQNNVPIYILMNFKIGERDNCLSELEKEGL